MKEEGKLELLSLTRLHWTQLVLIHMSSSLGSQPSNYDADGRLHQGRHQNTIQNNGAKLNMRTGRKLKYFIFFFKVLW